MRILQVVHWFLPKHTAGSEVYTYQLSRELARRHQVAIYCREDGHPERAFVAEEDHYQGLPVHRVYYNPAPGPTQLARRALARFRNRRIAADFAAYLDSFTGGPPDVVHFQHLFKLSGDLIALCRRRGIPTVVTLHDYWYLCDNGQLLRPGLRPCSGPLGGLRCPGCAELPLPVVARWALAPALWPLFLHRTAYLRRRLRQADAIISPSAHLAEVYARHGFDRILVSDNGSDLSWQAERGHPLHAPLRFGYIGTIAPHKGLHVLLEAFAGLGVPAELWVYGGAGADGGYAAEMRAWDAPGVRFLGPFAHGEIARVLAEIDVLVVPSVWAENSPVTIHEARTARVPVLAAEIGGMRDLVREGHAGWLFRSGDAGDLRRQMRWLVEDPALVAQVSEGILPVKSIAEQAAELESLYARLARQSA